VSIWQPIEAHGEGRKTDLDYDFTLALKGDSENLLRPPISHPQTSIVPTRRLADGETGQQGLHFRHIKTPSLTTSAFLFLLVFLQVKTGDWKSIRKDFDVVYETHLIEMSL
jgi:hypothetical protein